MKSLIQLSLMTVALVQTFPSHMYATSASLPIAPYIGMPGTSLGLSVIEKNNDQSSLHPDENLGKFSVFLDRFIALDVDETSPLHTLNNRIENEDMVVRKKDVLKAIDHAQWLLVEQSDRMPDDQLEELGFISEEILNLVNTNALDFNSKHIKTNHSKNGHFKNLIVYDDAIIVGNLQVFGEITTGPCEKKSKKCKTGATGPTGATGATGPVGPTGALGQTGTICDLTVTCSATIQTMEVLTSAQVDCDLHVGCNILMNDSTSSIGNVYKNNLPFIHNFGEYSTFVGVDAGNFNMTGCCNTGCGINALHANTTGERNTGIGVRVLEKNTTGIDNTAVGSAALLNNETGEGNTGIGVGVLQNNTTGIDNTAVGTSALYTNDTGYRNTAVGVAALQGIEAGAATASRNSGFGRSALFSIDSGNENVAVGHRTLGNLTDGNRNTAVGAWEDSIGTLTTGSNNIFLGYNAGTAYRTSDSQNIAIGNAGVLGENGTIRIGDPATHTKNIQAGIFGVMVNNASSVSVDEFGQLGITPSSIRYKENIKNMHDESTPILDLRPVIFNYKSDPSLQKQFGLIAEEVAEVLPNLVVRDLEGQIETVKYHELIPMLLNELIKQNAIIQELKEEMNARLGELEK